MEKWQIPPGDSADVSLKRLHELQNGNDGVIKDQHVVSKVIQRGFAIPGRAGKGWELTPFDLRYDRELRARGLDGCGKVPHFLAFASKSAEHVWNTAVENQLPMAIAAARDG